MALELEILTPDPDLASVCRLYWELDSTQQFVHSTDQVAELAGVAPWQLASLARDACRASIADWTCSTCGKARAFASRSDFSKQRARLVAGSYQHYTFICSVCQEKKREAERIERIRQEEAARLDREKAEAELRVKIRETYRLEERTQIDVESLSLTDAVFLLSILRGGAYEDVTKIKPVEMFEHPLAADPDLSTEIVNRLCEKGLLTIHPDTAPRAFAEPDLSRFYTFRVEFAPPISRAAPEDPKALFVQLHRVLEGDWPDAWYDEGLTLWKKIALSESQEYLLLALKEHHFDFSPGEKTTQYLEYALEHFSTAQVYNTIWRAVKDAAAFHRREGTSSKHAANAAIASIQRISERAVAEKWEVTPFRRNYSCPQAIVSEVLYNLALQIGSDGFNLVPNIDSIRVKKRAAGSS